MADSRPSGVRLLTPIRNEYHRKKPLDTFFGVWVGSSALWFQEKRNGRADDRLPPLPLNSLGGV